MTSHLRSVPVLGADAPSTPAWLRRPVIGRHADRDLPNHLQRELNGIAAILHDVRLPASSLTLDHAVVAPSGIWLIDVLNISGRLTRRDVGTRSEPELRMLIDGVDHSDLVDSFGILRESRDAIAEMQLGVEVHSAVCLIDTTWPMSARPFKVRNHWITWPRALTDKIRSSGLVPIRTAYDIADAISERQTNVGDAAAAGAVVHTM